MFSIESRHSQLPWVTRKGQIAPRKIVRAIVSKNVAYIAH